jgi:uncharacterized protein
MTALNANLWSYIAPVLFLCLSNVFMTFAWYGHLRFTYAPLWLVIPISWGIAFFEYCLAVPANRIGFQVYSATQLKTMQEVITLAVFVAFSAAYLGDPVRWRDVAGFALIAAGAFLVFQGRG